MKAEYRATIPRQFRWAFCVAVKSLAALSTHYGEKSQTPGVINNTTLRSTYFVLVVTQKSLLRYADVNGMVAVCEAFGKTLSQVPMTLREKNAILKNDLTTEEIAIVILALLEDY